MASRIDSAKAVSRIGHDMRRARVDLLIASGAAVGLACSGSGDRLHDPVIAAVVLDIAQAVRGWH